MESTAITAPTLVLSVPTPLPRLGPPPTLREQGGNALVLAGLVHDARNLVTAFGLCAEMISEPGVLAPKHGHYAADIRSIAQSSTHLVERLSNLCRTTAMEQTLQPTPVTDLSESLHKMSPLLAAIAGPVTEVEIACLPCPGELRLSEEDLSRILMNLVRNAADAMPTGGRIRVTTQLGGGGSFLWAVDPDGASGQPSDYLQDDSAHPTGSAPHTVLLTIEDNGPGIPGDFIERVFDAGFSTKGPGRSWPSVLHQGLGLSIVRQLVEAAGGTVKALPAPSHGARFEIELPLTIVTPYLPSVPPLNDQLDPQ